MTHLKRANFPFLAIFFNLFWIITKFAKHRMKSWPIGHEAARFFLKIQNFRIEL
jgi:hypothetical protein